MPFITELPLLVGTHPPSGSVRILRGQAAGCIKGSYKHSEIMLEWCEALDGTRVSEKLRQAWSKTWDVCADKADITTPPLQQGIGIGSQASCAIKIFLQSSDGPVDEAASNRYGADVSPGREEVLCRELARQPREEASTDIRLMWLKLVW
jgi:hypothetical protein